MQDKTESLEEMGWRQEEWLTAVGQMAASKSNHHGEVQMLTVFHDSNIAWLSDLEWSGTDVCYAEVEISSLYATRTLLWMLEEVRDPR